MKIDFIKSKIFSRIGSNTYHQQYSHYLFNDIVGYDDIKELFERAIMSSSSNKQIHLLLCGPPASAKSLFMHQLIKLEKSYFTLGSHSSKSGMVDALFEKQPKYLIVDEIEKMSTKDQAVLLSLMEKGIVAETKYKRAREIRLNTSVFAATNGTKKLLPPLLTRFSVLHLQPYTFEEFREITQRVLYNEERIDMDIAGFIADAVWNKMKSTNIRDCIRIGRIATTANTSNQVLLEDDVRRIIEIFLKYNNNNNN